MTPDPRQELEEKLAHLERVVSDLSDVIARQDTQITLMSRRIGLLMERAADAEMADGGTAPIGDQRPPHY